MIQPLQDCCVVGSAALRRGEGGFQSRPYRFITEAQREELGRRLESYGSSRGPGATWESVKERLLANVPRKPQVKDE